MRVSTSTVRQLSAVIVCVLGMACAAQAVLPEGLVAYYKLDATSGLTAMDETGAHDGTLTGSLSWVEGIKGNALQFIGGNGSPFVDLGAWQTDGPEGLSFCLWAKWAGANGSYQGLLSQREGTMYWWSEMPPGGTNVLFKSNTSPQSIVTLDTGTMVEDEWVHLAFSHDAAAGTGVAYLNGVEQVSGNWSLPDGDFSNLRTGIGVVNTGDGLGTFNGALDEVLIFDRPTTADEVVGAMNGYSDPTASAPSPAGGALDVPRDAVLAWRPGQTAVAHDVYFGTSFEDVSAADRTNPLGVLLSQAQDANTYVPDNLLEFGRTYYWRVDEVNGAPDHTIFPGEVWSFTAEPFAYPIENIVATTNGISDDGVGIEKTIDGSGLNGSDQHSIEASDMWLAAADGTEPIWLQYEFDRVYKLHEMWVWNYNIQFELMLGFGLKDVTIEYSVDGVDWAVLTDAEFAQATAKFDYAANTIVDFEGVAARYVRLTVNSKWGPMPKYGLSEVRFFQIPAFAREPQPVSGAASVSVDTKMSWRAGRGAASHEVSFGTDEVAVADGTALVDAVTASCFSPESLNFGTTYYWKVDEVNEAEAVPTWEGALWSFSTQEYVVIENFESYNDEDNCIFDTWIDGWVNETGSIVGYLEAPFAERSIVHSGMQSMPLEYDNTTGPFYSEAQFDLGSADWTSNGADTLRVFVRGQTPPFSETSDGAILMNAVGSDIWGNSDEFRYAYKSLSGDGSMVARVDWVGNTNDWAKAGVMIRETLDASSAHAMVVVTPTSGVSFQRRPEAGASSESTTADDLAAPYWVKITRTGNVFTAQRSEDGLTWVSITDDPAASTVEIPMADEVFIGLALTSHEATITTGAQFSEASTTGNVTGQWQTADVGVPQPTSGNTSEPLYVALEDSNGHVAIVTHETATLVSNWQEWLIPLDGFTGVNLGRLQTLYLGVGDRSNPVGGGTGLVYIDDIAVGHPAATE